MTETTFAVDSSFSADSSETPDLPPVVIPKGSGAFAGDVYAPQAFECSIIDGITTDDEAMVLIVLADTGPDSGIPRTLGMFLPLDAAQARTFAAALLRTADKIDGGMGKQ